MVAVISATDVELPKPINAIMQQQFLRQAAPLCTYFTGAKKTAAQMHGGTNTVKWRRVNSFTPSVTALAEQTGNATFFGGRDSVGAGITDITATLLKYGLIVTLSEEASIYNPKEQEVEVIKALGIAGGRSLNMLQRNILEDNTTTIYYSGDAANTAALVSKIQLTDFEKAIAALTIANAMPFTAMSNGSTNIGTSPVQQCFWGHCHPYVRQDITKMAGFKPVEAYSGQTNIVKGEFGMVYGPGYGVRMISTSEATADIDAGGALGSTGLRSTGGTSIDVYTTVIVGMEAHGGVGLGKMQPDGSYTASGVDSLPETIELVKKDFGSGGTSDPLNEIKTIAYKFFHTGAILNQDWCAIIKSGATKLV